MAISELDKVHNEQTQEIEKIKQQMLAEEPILLDLADSHARTKNISPFRTLFEELGLIEPNV